VVDVDWSLPGIGVITGLLVGVTGVGGGAVMTPLLVLHGGVAPLTAVGTDLWCAAFTKAAASGLHYRTQLIEWRVVRRLWMGSLPAAALSLLWLGPSVRPSPSRRWVWPYRRACTRWAGRCAPRTRSGSSVRSRP
jgi:uncharacterized membrane protein YfcA